MFLVGLYSEIALLACKVIDCAIKDIASGRAGLVLAGGTEAMSRAPLIFNKKMTTWFAKTMGSKTLGAKLGMILKLRPSYFKPIIALLCGLKDPFYGDNMGQTAEQIAYDFGITREEMDAFAEQSQQRAEFAKSANPERTPLYDAKGKIYQDDDGIREDTSLAKLAKLKPIFDRKFGAVTAGNSSQVTDGASLMLLASEEAVKQLGLKPRAKIIDIEWAALDPRVMGLGPVCATIPLLQRNKLNKDDIDYWEINEAFAAQVLGCLAAFSDDAFCKKYFGMDKAFGGNRSSPIKQRWWGYSSWPSCRSQWCAYC